MTTKRRPKPYGSWVDEWLESNAEADELDRRTNPDNPWYEPPADPYVEAATANPERYASKASDGGQAMIYRRDNA